MREFGLALRSGPFRVALVISLVVHLVLLVVVGWGGLGREGKKERRIPLMRVRLLSPAPLPADVPAAPTVKPAVRQTRREQPERPTAAVPMPPPTATPQDSESLAPPAAHTPAQVPEASAREEAPAQDAVQTAAAPSVDVAPPSDAAALLPEGAAPPASPGVAQSTPALAAGDQGTGPARAAVAPATPGNGSVVSSAARPQSDGSVTAGRAIAGAGAVVAAPAAASTAGPAAPAAARQEPGPRDLAAVRRRIEARKVYPQIAVRNGWEGRVLVEMQLEGDGRLAAVRLLEGSGYAVLDDATIAAVHLASPFPPIARVLHVPVEYRLLQ
jgi:periplasmic protein TonB